MKNWRLLSAVVAWLLLMSGTAWAEGFGLYEYSARGVALSGSVMARKPDASAVAYNPALLTQLPGVNFMAGTSFIYPRGKMRTTDANGVSDETLLKRSIWTVPHAYYTHQINDDWWFGLGEFTRFGLGFEYPHDWPGRFNIYEVNLQSFSLNPVFAWKATKDLSLAAGIELVYVNLDIRKRAQVDARAMGYGVYEVDTNITDADALGVGFNLAGHYKFNEEWAVGLQYRSQVRVHAAGHMNYNNVDTPEPIYQAMFNDGGASSTVYLPDSIAGGISWTPRQDLSFEVGAIWTRWSTFRHLNIHLPDDRNSNNNKHWRDAWRLNAGVEYDALDWLTLRAGYAYDQSPMTDEYADYLVPTASRNIYSLGVGFKWGEDDAWTLDLAYACIDAKKRSYRASDETYTLDSKVRQGVTDVVTMTLGYSF